MNRIGSGVPSLCLILSGEFLEVLIGGPQDPLYRVAVAFVSGTWGVVCGTGALNYSGKRDESWCFPCFSGGQLWGGGLVGSVFLPNAHTSSFLPSLAGWTWCKPRQALCGVGAIPSRDRKLIQVVLSLWSPTQESQAGRRAFMLLSPLSLGAVPGCQLHWTDTRNGKGGTASGWGTDFICIDLLTSCC